MDINKEILDKEIISYEEREKILNDLGLKNKDDLLLKVINEQLIQHEHPKDFFIDKKKIFGKELYKELIEYIGEIILLNNEHIGKKISHLKIELNIDPEVLYIKEQLINLFSKYCQKRLLKINPKDTNDLFKYIRLLKEIYPELFTLTHKPNSIFSFFFHDILEHISYIYSKKIFNHYEDFNVNRVRIKKFYENFNLLNLDRSTMIYSLINNDSSLETLFYTLNYNLTNYSNDSQELIKRLKILIDDIIEMKPFIYKDSLNNKYQSIEIIKNSLSLYWHWDYEENSVGKISLFFKNNLVHKNYSIKIDTNGICFEPSLKRINTLSIFDETNEILTIQINLLILEKIHEYFYSLYDEIDMQEYLDKYINQEIDKEVDKEYELKAMSIISEELSKEANKDIKKRSYQIRSNTTWNKFLKILKEKFNCKVVQGKGDDIKIYRLDEKTKIYRTSNPNTKKQEILVQTQIAILKRIGVSVKEWIEVNKPQQAIIPF